MLIIAAIAMPKVTPHQILTPEKCQTNAKIKAEPKPINQNPINEEYIGKRVSFKPRKAPNAMIRKLSNNNKTPAANNICLTSRIKVTFAAAFTSISKRNKNSGDKKKI